MVNGEFAEMFPNHCTMFFLLISLHPLRQRNHCSQPDSKDTRVDIDLISARGKSRRIVGTPAFCGTITQLTYEIIVPVSE